MCTPARHWRLWFGLGLMIGLGMQAVDARAAGFGAVTGQGCDPTMQSCAPGVPVTPPPPLSCGPAAGGATACGNGTATMGNQSGAPLGAGNPINVITGNKYQREEDLPALPGILGLEIVRHYNSLYSRADNATGIFGRGWKLSYETDLYVIGNTVQIMQADGTRVIFSRDPRNPSVCTTVQSGAGRLGARHTARGEEFTWTWNDGRILSFDAGGKLIQIAVPSGEFVSLQRDAKGFLTQVTDPQGRRLTLSYGIRSEASLWFRGVASIDSPVGRFRYGYGGDALAPAATPGRLSTANLASVLFPEDSGHQVLRAYHYEDVRHPGFMTGISVRPGSLPEGKVKPSIERVATYLYNRDGKAILSVRGRPARLERNPDGAIMQPAHLVAGTGIGQVTLDFSNPGKTVLTNSLGQVTTYRHGLVAGQHRLHEAIGAGCSQCGEMNVRYQYDRLGQLVATTRLDQAAQPIEKTVLDRDALGRVTRVSSIGYAGTRARPSVVSSHYLYRADTELPATITRPSVVSGREVVLAFDYNERGQVITTAESGWSPARQGLAGLETVAPIVRSQHKRYVMINGRSLLAQIADAGVSEDTATVPPAAAEVQWDASGSRIITLTIAGKYQTGFRYDTAGRVAGVTNVDGATTAFMYNARGQLLSSSANGSSEMRRYDARGNLSETGVADANGYHVAARFSVNAGGGSVRTTTQRGTVERQRLDTEGKLQESIVQSGASRQVHRYAYDALGQMTLVTQPNGGQRRIRWNAHAMPEAIVDTLGRETRFAYDAADMLVTIVPASNARQSLQQDTSIRFTYDLAGNTADITAPGGTVTRQLIDDFGRKTASYSSDGGTRLHDYDRAGRLCATTDGNGNRTLNEYNAGGQRIRKTVIDASAGGGGGSVVTSWTFSGTRLVAISHRNQSEQLTYDPSGRLATREVDLRLADGVVSRSLTRYSYDEAGQLIGSTLADGSSVVYVRNSQNQITGLMRRRMQTPWLRWLMPDQVIVQNLRRDMVGLTAFDYGNGVQANYQRAPDGTLVSMAYRTPQQGTGRPHQRAIDAGGTAMLHVQFDDQEVMQTLSRKIHIQRSTVDPEDPGMLMDHWYRWDLQGNLIDAGNGTTRQAYRYDALDRLIVAATTARQQASRARPASDSSMYSSEGHFARYYYDGAGNRLMGQEAVSPEAGLQAGTIRSAYHEGSNRLRKAGETDAPRYDQLGQETSNGERSYRWNADGKLAEVWQSNNLLARYGYDHQGLRVSKHTAGTHTYYLHEGRLTSAELDANGRIRRQYLFLAGQPIAVVDMPDGVAPSAGSGSAPGWIAEDAATLWRHWCHGADRLTFLHMNHLGAPEMATDPVGNLVWQIGYEPYGHGYVPGHGGGTPDVKTIPVHARTRNIGEFSLDLRLPGQVEDAETGLHFNDHRYYDPARGRYLTPDPLGVRGGLNSYAYAAGNPLKYVDPSGLILFAFDGTGNNSNPDSKSIDSTNIAMLYNFYDASVAGQGSKTYQRGIGTDPNAFNLTNTFQQGLATEGRSVIDSQLRNLNNYVGNLQDPRAQIVLDVIGFSRGAAEARDFSNRVLTNYRGKKYGAHCMEFRFLGLFDTVSQFYGADTSIDVGFDFSIAPQWKSVAQAYALNEHRALFPLRTIQGAPAPHVEQGFVGAHSDIGGGYLTGSEKYPGDLSDVALMWMVRQAGLAGVKFTTIDDEFRQVTRPVVHDQDNTSVVYGSRAPVAIYDLVSGKQMGFAPADERAVILADGSRTTQTAFGGSDPRYGKLMEGLINRPVDWQTRRDNCAGAVDMQAYRQWLRANLGMTMQPAMGETTQNICKA